MTVPQVQFELANPFGILVDETHNAWHAGHTQDALALSDGTIVALAETSGVWLLRGDETQHVDVAGSTEALLRVERGPDHPRQVFAGGGSLHVTADLVSWSQLGLPAGATAVSDLRVTGATRRLYVATDAGVFWAAIPDDYLRGGFAWNSVPPNQAFRSLHVWSSDPAWSSWTRTPAFESRSAIVAASRYPQQVDLFAVDAHGQLATTWGPSTGAAFTTWTPIGDAGTVLATPGRVAAVSRTVDSLDLLALAPDGSPRSLWWSSSSGWSSWFTVGRPGIDRLDTRGPIAMVTRTSDSLDVFGLGGDGRVYTNQRPAPTAGSWQTWRPVGTAADVFAATAGVTVVAREHGAHLNHFGIAHVPGPDERHLDLFAISPDGQVKATWTDDACRSWGTWYVVGDAAARLDPASGVSAVARRGDHLDLFARGLEGGIYSSYWHEGSGWSNWFRVGAGVIDSGVRIQAVAPNPEEIHLTVVGTDGQVWTTWWSADLPWQQWLPVSGLAGFAPAVGAAMICPHRDDVVVVGQSGSSPAAARWSPSVDRVLAAAVKGAGDNTVQPFWSGRTEVVGGSTALQLSAAGSITGVSTQGMGTTSLAGSAYRPLRAYAVSANADGTVYAVLKTTDGGTNWTACSTSVLGTNPQETPTLQALAGGQGADWNNCIAVDPSTGETAIIGWVDRFVSQDSGGTWQRFLSGNPHTHADHHGIRFDRLDTTGRTVLISSDGGLCLTRDLGATADSSVNKWYANLEFYAENSRRQFYGGMGSGQIQGLVAGGTQDNANLWCQTVPHPTAWRKLDWGDGGLCFFVHNGDLLYSQPANGVNFHKAHFDTARSTFVDDGELPITRRRDGDVTRTGIGGAAAAVNDPVSRDAFGATVLAVGCPWPSGDVYTGWAGSVFLPPRWEFEVSLPLAPDEAINALGSANSTVIHCGTTMGRLFRVDAVARSAQESGLATTLPDHLVSQIAVATDTLAYALYLSGPTDSGLVLKLDATNTWTPVGGAGLPDAAFYGIDLDWTVQPNTVFVCTDSAVYASADEGANWSRLTTGLPANPHCSDLRFSVQPDRTRMLYVSTFGRSLWQSPLT